MAVGPHPDIGDDPLSRGFPALESGAAHVGQQDRVPQGEKPGIDSGFILVDVQAGASNVARVERFDQGRFVGTSASRKEGWGWGPLGLPLSSWIDTGAGASEENATNKTLSRASVPSKGRLPDQGLLFPISHVCSLSMRIVQREGRERLEVGDAVSSV